MLYIVSILIFLLPTILIYEYRLRKLRKKPVLPPQTMNFDELRKFADISKILRPNYPNLFFVSNGDLHFYCHMDISIEEFIKKTKEKLFTKGDFGFFHKNELTCYEHELEDKLKTEEIELTNRKNQLREIRIDRELTLLNR